MDLLSTQPRIQVTSEMAESGFKQPIVPTPHDPRDHVVARLRLIGQIEAWTAGAENLLPSGRKTRALLAVVALSAPKPALRGRLAELLWSRRPEEQARASLRQEIHRLTESLSPAKTEIIQVTREHLVLRPDSTWVDVHEVMRATPRQPASLALLDGELLEGLDGVDPSFDLWLVTERERLLDRARSVAETALKDQTDADEIIPAAQRLLQIDRAHEGAWRALMRAYAERGERGMAVQAYDRCRAVLADMMDAVPSQETQKLLTELRGPASNRLPMRPPSAPAPDPEPEAGSGPERADKVTPGIPVVRQEARPGHGGAQIGVLPLQLVGAGPNDSHLATGLAEEITTALMRFRWMFVVSSSSLARFAAESRDESAIRDTFGLDFLLDGTVHRIGSRLRANMRLVDLRAGNQIVWAQRFDRESDDLLSLQDEIAAAVVAQIDPAILLIEARRSASRPHVDASAYDLMLRALPLISRLERGPFIEGGDYLRRSIILEPEYAAAHAWYAYWHVFLVGQGWAEDPQAALETAGELAERAIVLDPVDARGLSIAGHVRAYLHRRLRDAISLHERALSLNPNLAMAWALSAITCAYAGQLDEADHRIKRYKQLSPMDPYAFIFDGFWTVIYLLRGDYEAAATAGRDVTQMNSALSAGFKPYVAALGYLNRPRELLAARERLLALEPDFTVERFLSTAPFEREVDRRTFADGLRRAGIPEKALSVAPVPAV